MMLHAPVTTGLTRPTTATQSAAVLRRCGCGGTFGGGECADCRRRRQALRRSATAGSSTRSAARLLQRQEQEKAPPTNEDKLKDAAKKVGEALLETDVGKELKKKAEELGKDFVSSLSGKVVTGAAAAGALAYIVAKNEELPMQLPEIPLDRLASGLKVSLTWKGPVRSPSSAMLTFTFRPGSASATKKPVMTEAEKRRAETAKLSKELAEFREGLKSPEQRAAEEAAFWKAYYGGMNRYGLRPLGVPGTSGPTEEKKREEGTLQRHASPRAGRNDQLHAPAIVEDTLSSSGSPLPHATRTQMERHFGHDFARVRVHTDRRAADSAAAVEARAYTVGSSVVFGAGEYAPDTASGRRLLAHELTHVVQQQSGTPPVPQRPGIVVGAVDDPLEREADDVAAGVAAMNAGQTAAAGMGTARPSAAVPHVLRRAVRRENVSCRDTGLRNPDLTGSEAVAAIEAADQEAITLARRAELSLDFHLLFAQAGDPIDAAFDTILQEELGLTLTNAAHFPLIEQQRDRFRRVRETLESGYLRYMCRGGNVSLVGCAAGNCTDAFAFTCPGNRLVVLCQPFWDEPAERAGTILHEPFHIWFHMARHDPSALRRADASCFEAFALRLAGRAAPMTCAAHTGG
jgi:hypothetical protein